MATGAGVEAFDTGPSCCSFDGQCALRSARSMWNVSLLRQHVSAIAGSSLVRERLETQNQHLPTTAFGALLGQGGGGGGSEGK